jgi:sRNA-binding protein
MAEHARDASVAATAALGVLMGKDVGRRPGQTAKERLKECRSLKTALNNECLELCEEEAVRKRDLLGETSAARAAREAKEQAAATKAESAQKVKDEKKAAKDLAAAQKKTEAADKKAASSSTTPKAKPKAKPRAKAKAKAKATDTGDQTTLAVSVGDGAAESTETTIEEETDPEVLRGLIRECEEEKEELRKVLDSDATPEEKRDATRLYGEEVRISALLYKRLQVIAGAGQGQEQEPGQDGQGAEPPAKRQCTDGVQQDVLVQDETAPSESTSAAGEDPAGDFQRGLERAMALFRD